MAHSGWPFGIDALTLLLPLGVAGVAHVVPITAVIVALLLVVYFSYRQTISAYPNGGGSYTVARENLHPSMALVAGAAAPTGISALVTPSYERWNVPVPAAMVIVSSVFDRLATSAPWLLTTADCDSAAFN